MGFYNFFISVFSFVFSSLGNRILCKLKPQRKPINQNVTQLIAETNSFPKINYKCMQPQWQRRWRVRRWWIETNQLLNTRHNYFIISNRLSGGWIHLWVWQVWLECIKCKNVLSSFSFMPFTFEQMNTHSCKSKIGGNFHSLTSTRTSFGHIRTRIMKSKTETKTKTKFQIQ